MEVMISRAPPGILGNAVVADPQRRTRRCAALESSSDVVRCALVLESVWLPRTYAAAMFFASFCSNPSSACRGGFGTHVRRAT
jgi:hypothetical protein